MWSFNSRAQLRLIVGHPRPGRGLEHSMLHLSPELLRLLARLSEGEGLDTLPPGAFEQLSAVGLLVPSDSLGEPVCFAPWLPPALAPAGTPAPPDWPAGLLPDANLIWPPANGLPRLPLCLAAAHQAPGALAWVAPGAGADWPALWQAGRQQLARQGFAVLRGLLSPLHLDALRAYLHELSLAGYFEPDLEQVRHRDTIYNHPLLQYLHGQLSPLLQPLLPQPVEASYSILALYHGRAELERHIDRAQCAWNASLLLAAEPADAAAWPLWLEHHGAARAVSLAPGDLVVYSGTRTPHWRPRLPPGQQVFVGLFHFVARGFIGRKA